MAKEMQKAIVSVGNGMIEKKEVKTSQSFRYVILENTYLKDTQLFLYPLALVKLALFIMICHKVRRTQVWLTLNLNRRDMLRQSRNLWSFQLKMLPRKQHLLLQ